MSQYTTTAGNETIIYTYDDSGQFTNGEIITTGAYGSRQDEMYDANWQLTGATSLVVTDDGQQNVTSDISYTTNWTMTRATVAIVSDYDPFNSTNEVFDGNWNLISASISTDYHNGPISTVITYNYGANWTATGSSVRTEDEINSNTYTLTETYYDASGNLLATGSASWLVNGTEWGNESWTTGSHQVTITETPGSETAGPLDVVTDVAYDNAGEMTGARIFTYGIQGQGFNRTEEDYDANWHLTSWRGDAPGIDMVSSWTDDASGNSFNGTAVWSIYGNTNFEAWATGTHSLTLTETANPGSAVLLDRLTDVAFDNSGAMTGAKIFTYGIQGQAFTQTEEDYDASWHLTSWHGVGPNGYDQTVSYMV